LFLWKDVKTSLVQLELRFIPLNSNVLSLRATFEEELNFVFFSVWKFWPLSREISEQKQALEWGARAVIPLAVGRRRGHALLADLTRVGSTTRCGAI
jgi:hypothetical protein